MRLSAIAVASLLALNAPLFADASDVLTNTDREVLATVTASICHRMHKGYEVLDSVATSQGLSRASLRKFDRHAVANLLARNASSPRLPDGITCSRLKIVETAEITESFAPSSGIPPTNPPDWRHFYAAFPGANGVTRLSLPGYSEDGRVALVLVSGACDSLCGSGFLWELEKLDGTWMVKRTEGMWIS